ncbi:MAG: prepilin-type N-terminal cleavage/methylation domain-containing protein [Nitrospira sp.]|nr:prepilin-type N-terminal cleavage/methylation domain-containing protein [Nitrospira sp.]
MKRALIARSPSEGRVLLKSLDKQQGYTLIELMIAMAILGLLAGLAIPTYMRYQAKARQAEAATNLGAIFVTETAFFGEAARYSNFTEAGFSLAAASNRFTYRAEQTTSAGLATGAVQVISAAIGPVTPDNTIVPARSNLQQFTATATANLDEDATIDQWHVDDVKRGLTTPDNNDITS